MDYTLNDPKDEIPWYGCRVYQMANAGWESLPGSYVDTRVTFRLTGKNRYSRQVYWATRFLFVMAKLASRVGKMKVEINLKASD